MSHLIERIRDSMEKVDW